MRARLLVVTNLLATIAVALAQGVSLTRQQSALLLLKASLSSNETVQALNSWNPQTNVCSSWQGVQCNGQGVVTALRLNNVGLRGQLPFSDNVWSALPELQTVNLGNNFVGGYLPPNIGTLNNLESLNLSGNQFNGVLPPKWGNLSKLQNLDLGNNYLGGSLPPQWSSLTNLQTLNLGIQMRGGFTGGVPPQWRQTQGGNTTGLTSLQNLNVQVAGADCFAPNFKPPPNFICGAPGQPSLQSPPPPAPTTAQPTTPAASQTAAPLATQTVAPTAKQTTAPTAKQAGVAATKAPTQRVTIAPTRAAVGILSPPPIAQQPAPAPSIAGGPGVAPAPALRPASELAPGPAPSLAPALVPGAGVGPAPSVGPVLAPNVGPSAAVRNTSAAAAATLAPTANAATALQTTFGVTGLTPSQFTSVKDQFAQIVSDAAQTPAGSTTVQSVTAVANTRRLLLFRRELLQTQNSLSITSLTQTNDPAAAARNIQAAIADGSLPQKLRALGLIYVPGSFTSLPTNVRQSSSGSSNSKRLAKIIVPSVVGGLIIIALLLCCCLFCLAKNKKRKERSTVGRVQPGKEYPVSDTSGYTAPPGDDDIDVRGGARDAAPAVAATGAGLAAVGLASSGAASIRAVDTSHPKVYVAPTINEPANQFANESVNEFANEPVNAFANEPVNKFANEPVNEPIFFKPTDANAFDDRFIDRGDRHEILKDHPIVREGDYHVYPASVRDPLLVPNSRAVSGRGTGRSNIAPLAAGTAAVAAGVGVAAAHGRQHSDSFESNRSSFESAQDTDPPGRAGTGFGDAGYASSFATAKPAAPVVAGSVGPSAASRSLATAMPYTQPSAAPGYIESFVTCKAQEDPVTSRQADSFATARQAAGSAIPGSAYAESFITAVPANRSMVDTTPAPSFVTAVPQGSTSPTTEYPGTLKTAAAGTMTQVGRRSTEYPETYVTAKPATPEQAGAAGQGGELAESFITAAQGAPTVASREPDDIFTSPQSLQSRGPMVAAAGGAAATIGAAATYAIQHESDRPQEIALARQLRPPMSSGQDYVPVSEMESSSRNEPTLAAQGDSPGDSSEPTSSSTNTNVSSLGLEGAYDIGKGGAGGSRATATRGIVGMAGKMKYFSTRKSYPASRSPPPADSTIPSEALSAEASGTSSNLSPIAVDPGMARRGSRGSFDSAEGFPLPGLASRREDLPADYATHSFSTAKEAHASDFVSESASSRRAPTSTDPPAAFASTSFSTAKEPNPSELLSLATNEGISTPTTGQSYTLGDAQPAASAAEPERLRAPAIITPRTGHVAERASLFGGQSRVESPPPAGTSTGGAMPQSARLDSMAPDLDLDRYASAQSNMTFQSATSQALQSESSLPMPRQGSVLGPGAAAALTASGTPPDSARWSGFDTSRSGWETARSRAESSMPASARGGMTSGRGVPSGSPAPGEAGGFDTARSGTGGTPRSAFSGNTPRQYSYRSNASGDDVTGETPRDRIGLGGDLSAHAMPGDTGATLSPRPIQFTDSDDSSSNSSERQQSRRDNP